MMINNTQFSFANAEGAAQESRNMYSHTDALINKRKKPRVSQSHNYRDQKKGLYDKFGLGSLEARNIG